MTSRKRAVVVLATAMSLHATSCGTTDDGSDPSVGSGTTSTSGASSGAPSDTSTSGAASGSESGSGADTEPPPPIEPVVVMTFNVLCSLCSSGYEPWDARVPYMADTIERHAPQLVGLQEVATAEEVEQIQAALGGTYEAIYWHDDDDAYADALVLYDPVRFSALESGEYWLSPEPDVAFSTGFSGSFQLARLVVWVRLTDLPSGRELVFATTHFDNNSPSQELSAPLVLERTEMLGGADLPTIVVGDFNAQPTDLAYEILTQGEGGAGFRFDDVFDLARAWSIDTNAPTRPEYDPTNRIDHMFVSGAAWTSPWWTVDMHTYGPDALYVSDHFAMAAELTAE